MVIPSLIKQTFAFLDGDDISNWLEELGCKCEWRTMSCILMGWSRLLSIGNSTLLIPMYVLLSLCLDLIGLGFVAMG